MPLPLENPRPDVDAFIAALDGRATPTRPPLFEYLVDAEMMKTVVRDMIGRPWADPAPGDRVAHAAYLDNYAAFWHHLGYDTLRLPLGLRFPSGRLVTADTAQGSTRQRSWLDEHTPTIASWDDFERLDWPDPRQLDLWPLEYLSRHLPEGMGMMVEHGGHIYEHVSSMFTYEGLALAIYDRPDLVQAVTDRVGGLILDYYRQVVDLDRVVAILTGDDMGFRSGTFLRPEDMERYFLPWHARISDLAHERGRRRYLHSCGNLASIMEYLIEEARIDGKHSFEDAIQPVEEFHRRYSDRIASLGGVDVDVLARGTVEEVRRRTREVIDACAPLGRFAVGSGNSIPSYVPLPNYLAMLEEALR